MVEEFLRFHSSYSLFLVGMGNCSVVISQMRLESILIPLLARLLSPLVTV